MGGRERMKERSIIFSGPMVRAILEGRKTQTRRVVKPQPPEDAILTVDDFGRCLLGSAHSFWNYVKCPYGAPKNRLWVRETFALESPTCAVYQADQTDKTVVERWRPSIHMPRCASRITLEIVSVRVERLQDISEEDALDEGVFLNSTTHWATEAREAYHRLWESINGPGSWDKNPWVWVIEFKSI